MGPMMKRERDGLQRRLTLSWLAAAMPTQWCAVLPSSLGKERARPPSARRPQAWCASARAGLPACAQLWGSRFRAAILSAGRKTTRPELGLAFGVVDIVLLLLLLVEVLLVVVVEVVAIVALWQHHGTARVAEWRSWLSRPRWGAERASQFASKQANERASELAS